TVALFRRIEKKRYSKQALKLEHDFQREIHLMEKHGVRFNEQAAVQLYGELAQKREDLRRQLVAAFPPTLIEMKKPAYWTVKGRDDLQFATKGEGVRFCREFLEEKPEFVRGPNAIKKVPFNPGSTDQIAQRLTAVGWSPTAFTKTGKPKVDEEALEHCSVPEAELIREFLIYKKLIGQL